MSREITEITVPESNPHYQLGKSVSSPCRHLGIGWPVGLLTGCPRETVIVRDGSSVRARIGHALGCHLLERLVGAAPSWSASPSWQPEDHGSSRGGAVGARIRSLSRARVRRCR